MKTIYKKIEALQPGDAAGYNSITLKSITGKTYKMNKIAKTKSPKQKSLAVAVVQVQVLT